MKILVITDHFPPDVEGGYELRCEEACKWLHERDFKIQVLTTEYNGNSSNHKFYVNRILKQYFNGSTPKHWNFLSKIYYAIRDNYLYRRTVNHFKPDFLYIWRCQGISRSLVPEIFDSEIKTLIDLGDTWLKKVSKEHGPIYGFLQSKSSKVWIKSLKNFLLMLLPAISFGYLRNEYSLNVSSTRGVFCSNYLKQFHLENLIDCDHYDVVNTGVDTKLFYYKKKKVSNDSLILLFVGAHTKAKGIFVLFKQLKYIQKYTDKKIILNMVGQFHDENVKLQIKQLIKGFSKNIEINLKGSVDKKILNRHYHDAHFTIIPTVWDEPFSRVPLESMSCGTPCVAVGITGLKDLIKAKAPLLLFDGKNEDSLGKVLGPYCDLDEKYTILCKNSNNFINERFTFDQYMEKILKKIIA